MKHKGGNVYGSIYERKRKNGGISYTAEIQLSEQDANEIINTFGFDTPGGVFISGSGVG